MRPESKKIILSAAKKTQKEIIKDYEKLFLIRDPEALADAYIMIASSEIKYQAEYIRPLITKKDQIDHIAQLIIFKKKHKGQLDPWYTLIQTKINNLKAELYSYNETQKKDSSKEYRAGPEYKAQNRQYQAAHRRKNKKT